MSRRPVLHFVIGTVYPCPGGMQDSVLRVARGLAADGFEVFLYTHKQPAEHSGPCAEHAGVTVLHVGERIDFLAEPFEGVNSGLISFDSEKLRIDALVLRSEIGRRVEERSDRPHVLVSFYVSDSGFRAQQVATRLGLPHIASFRGTDYARDTMGVPGMQRVAFVVERAAVLVTTNQDQADGLRTLFQARQPIHTIHNAMERVERPVWETPPIDGPIRLLSDSGFSGRKATQALLRAVGDVRDRGLPVELTLVGGHSWPNEIAYWERIAAEYERRYPGVFAFHGHVSRDEVEARLREAHLYVSATLSEGCSLSRIRALTLGIPFVTTRCGALVEVAADCPHVLLAPPGDWQALADRLAEGVERTRAGELRPEPSTIAALRKHFSVERERDDWRHAIDAALSGEDS